MLVYLTKGKNTHQWKSPKEYGVLAFLFDFRNILPGSSHFTRRLFAVRGMNQTLPSSRQKRVRNALVGPSTALIRGGSAWRSFEFRAFAGQYRSYSWRLHYVAAWRSKSSSVEPTNQPHREPVTQLPDLTTHTQHTSHHHLAPLKSSHRT